MTTENKQPEVAVLDLQPLAKLVAFMTLNFSKIQEVAGYEYGTTRPVTLNRPYDAIDEVMADKRALVKVETENAGMTLFMKDVIAARQAYAELAAMFNKELKVPGGGNDVSDVEIKDAPGDSHTLSVFSHPSWDELRTVAMRHKDILGLEATRKFLADNGVNKVADLPYSSVDEVIIKLNTILREHGE